jgi:predicted cobalt transporter CbtA
MPTLGNGRLLASLTAAVTFVALSAGPALAGPPGGTTSRVSVAARNDGRAAGHRASAQASNPAIGLVKSASIKSYSTAGTPITYTYKVTNTGDVTLTNVTVTDPMANLSPINCGGGTNVIAVLNTSASHACSGTYTTTQGDVDTGSITNVGTATGSTPAGSSVSYHSSLTIPAPGHPFTCYTPAEPDYLSQSKTASGPTQLYYSTTASNVVTYHKLGSPYSSPEGHAYNALGFDTSSNYLYAMVIGTGTLIRIDSTGGVTSLGTVSGYHVATGGPAVGAFDNSGDYWITKGGGSRTAYEVNVTGGAPSATPLTLTGTGFKPYDWSWDSGYLWGVAGTTIYRVSTTEPTAGAVSTFPAPSGVASVSLYGASWTFGNGNLGFSNNQTGAIYQISVTNPSAAHPTFGLVSSYHGPKHSVKINDGAACVGQDTDLSIVKTGPATVTPSGSINWDIAVTNNGPGNSSGFAVDDAVPAGITDATTSTPGCTVTGNDVQCAEGPLDNGDSFTITLTGTAPATASTCVVNTATVTANETDPNADNNTSSVQTCTSPGFPSVGIVKSASIQSYSTAGTPITYTYQVTNTGDVTLTNVTVTDPMTGLSAINCGSGTNVIASLDPADSATCTATYTTTQADVEADSITNIGTATGTTPTGSTVSYNSSLTIPATSQPFTCSTPTDYLSQGEPTALYFETQGAGGGTYTPLGPTSTLTYNALGFDTQNGYLYAVSSDSPDNLLQIDSSGNVVSLGTISGDTLTAPYIGAFDADGDYWINDGSTDAEEVDVTSGSVLETLTLSQAFSADDWSLDSGYFWGLSGTTIYSMDPATGTVSTFPAPSGVAPVGGANAGTYGAAWTFSNGNLGFSNNNTGTIYQISVTNPSSTNPTFNLVSSSAGPIAAQNNNDGASCVGQDTDLSIVKTGPATVVAGGAITWGLTVTDNGPGNSSGFAVNDAVPAAVTNVTTSTPGCTVTGNHVQCAEGNLDEGDSFVITVSGTASPNDDKCVVNKATVTANEGDPNLGNNTSSVQTCTSAGTTAAKAPPTPPRRT